MINFYDVELGQTLFYVCQSLVGTNRKKIKMVDDSGVEWFRYDRDTWEYEVREYICVGRKLTTYEGDCDGDDEYRDDELYMRMIENSKSIMPIYYNGTEDWFINREEAEECRLKLEAEQKELNRS